MALYFNGNGTHLESQNGFVNVLLQLKCTNKHIEVSNHRVSEY